MISAINRSASTAACLFLWLCLAGMAGAQTPAGSVIGVSGPVTLDRGGQRYQPRLGDPVYTDDTFQVPAGGRVKLRLADGSILALAPGSSLRIDAFALDRSSQRQTTQLSLGQGLLRAITAPVGRPAAFEVDTAVGISSVRSTDWFVEAASGAQQVAVLTGSVSSTSRTSGGTVVVPAGSGSRIEAGGDPSPPGPLSQAEFANLIAATEEGVAPPPPGPYVPPIYAPPGPVIVPLPGRGFRAPPGGGTEPGGGRQPPPSRGKPG